ncbi:MAG: hypothetical protein ACETWO_04655 [Candidatus Hadarchaeaceae archaeon]
MGRTLHYRVKEAVTAEEFEQIREIANRYNARHKWVCENIKLWRETGGALWGFTKVNDSARDRKLVIRAIEEISKTTPRLTWLFFDEGWLGKCEWATFKGGKLK